jgi:hypothetical protein
MGVFRPLNIYFPNTAVLFKLNNTQSLRRPIRLLLSEPQLLSQPPPPPRDLNKLFKVQTTLE